METGIAGYPLAIEVSDPRGKVGVASPTTAVAVFETGLPNVGYQTPTDTVSPTNEVCWFCATAIAGRMVNTITKKRRPREVTLSRDREVVFIAGVGSVMCILKMARLLPLWPAHYTRGVSDQK